MSAKSSLVILSVQQI